MPIIRTRHKFEDHFTTIPNAWIRDPRLSLKAKGLLAQLMSHSPGWSVTIRSLAEANGCGKDLVASAISELERFGYLTRRQERSDDGRFSETVWQTSDPIADKPSPENPVSDNPDNKKTIYKEEQSKELPRTSFEEDFEEFWRLYPRKVEKIDARKAFEKAYTEHGDVIMDGVRRLSKEPNLPPLQFIPYPASWLRAGGWTNEPYPPREKSRAEIEAEAKARSQNERERRLEHTERLRRESEEMRATAAEPPRCVHDLALWKCGPCTRRLADMEADNPDSTENLK